MASFYLLADVHYFSKKNRTLGKPVLLRVRNDQISLLETPDILDSYIERILEDKDTNTVIFLGDNVDNSDMISHGEFRQRLEKLSSNGKRVFITYATHDYIGGEDDENNFQISKRFTADGTEPIPFMRRAQLPVFYNDFTSKNALSIHENSGSYSVKLDEKTLLIAIIDNGNGRSYCGLFDDGFDWLEKQTADAKNRGEYVLIAVHHPVLPPFDAYKNAAEEAMFGGYERLKKIMCRENVRVVFTGHTHFQNIRKYEDENGSWFYDVSTISLANPLGKMRKVTVNSDSGLCKIESIQTGVEKTGKSRSELYRQNFPGIWETLLPLAVSDYDEFINQSEGYLPSDMLGKYKIPIRFLCKKVNKMSLLSAAKLAGVKRKLTADERKAAKEIPLKQVVFELLSHVFTGNAEFTPERIEYKVINGVLKKADRLIDRFKLEKIKNAVPDVSVEKIGQDFLYNNRTGDDDSISFYLK